MFRRIGKIRKALLLLVFGILLQVAGSNCNKLVVRANHERMPVWNLGHKFDYIAEIDPLHYIITKDTKYVLLSDVIPFPAFGPAFQVILGMESLGDVSIDTGQLMVIFFWLPLGSGIIHRRKHDEVYS